MICIDSNLLIYAFNLSSEFHQNSIKILNDVVSSEGMAICDISLIEFFQVITDKRRLDKSLTNQEAKEVIERISHNERIKILSMTNIILEKAFSAVTEYDIEKYGIYDHIIAFCSLENHIKTIYTANTEDFLRYSSFLQVINPLKI
jgi:predicted nucleic acid-binding protein